MKKLIKLGLFVCVLLIFLFSNNPTVKSVRDFVLVEGKKIYSTSINKIKDSKNETVASVGKTIEP